MLTVFQSKFRLTETKRILKILSSAMITTNKSTSWLSVTHKTYTLHKFRYKNYCQASPIDSAKNPTNSRARTRDKNTVVCINRAIVLSGLWGMDEQYISVLHVDVSPPGTRPSTMQVAGDCNMRMNVNLTLIS